MVVNGLNDYSSVGRFLVLISPSGQDNEKSHHPNYLGLDGKMKITGDEMSVVRGHKFRLKFAF